MTIRSRRNARGNPIARCECDSCGAATEFPAKHQRDDRHGAEGHAMRKLTAMGWSQIGKTLRCPDCEAARKRSIHDHQPEDTIMTHNVAKLADVMPAELKGPSRSHERQIIALLEEVYDDKASRYIGGETDKTVAETIGGGVMPGWVAAIRERLFGPDGGNEDIERVRADIADITRQATALVEIVAQQSKNIADILGRAKEAGQRVEAIRKAVGPKAGR